MTDPSGWRVANLLPLLAVAQALLLLLKLGGVVQWSWIWILAPLWGFPVLVLLLGAALAISIWWHERP